MSDYLDNLLGSLAGSYNTAYTYNPFRPGV